MSLVSYSCPNECLGKKGGIATGIRVLGEGEGGSLPADSLFFEEKLTYSYWMGAILIISGIAIIGSEN